MAYSVSPADIEVRWRPLSDDETTLAFTLIADATTLIDVQRPMLAAAVASGAVPDRVVTMTVAEAVIRVLANPDLLSNQSVSADGGVSQGFQFAAKEPAPRMRLSLLDLQAVDVALGSAGISSGIAGSIRMRNSTSWSRRKAYRGLPLDSDDSEASDLTPNATVSDSVIISHS